MSDKTKADLEAELAEQQKAAAAAEKRAAHAEKLVADHEAKLAKADASPKKAAGETPAWQAPDYTGPLNCEQASWRHANIKPAGKAKAK